MEKFQKYYSYNQLIEDHDILVMSQEQYLQYQDQLDNPQQIVLVKRQGKPKEPKMPLWFKQWSEEIYEKKQPQWFKKWSDEVYKPDITSIKKRLDVIEEKLERNNIK